MLAVFSFTNSVNGHLLSYFEDRHNANATPPVLTLTTYDSYDYML